MDYSYGFAGSTSETAADGSTNHSSNAAYFATTERSNHVDDSKDDQIFELQAEIATMSAEYESRVKDVEKEASEKSRLWQEEQRRLRQEGNFAAKTIAELQTKVRTLEQKYRQQKQHQTQQKANYETQGNHAKRKQGHAHISHRSHQGGDDRKEDSINMEVDEPTSAAAIPKQQQQQLSVVSPTNIHDLKSMLAAGIGTTTSSASRKRLCPHYTNVWAQQILGHERLSSSSLDGTHRHSHPQLEPIVWGLQQFALAKDPPKSIDTLLLYLIVNNVQSMKELELLRGRQRSQLGETETSSITEESNDKKKDQILDLHILLQQQIKRLRVAMSTAPPTVLHSLIRLCSSTATSTNIATSENQHSQPRNQRKPGRRRRRIESSRITITESNNDSSDTHLMYANALSLSRERLKAPLRCATAQDFLPSFECGTKNSTPGTTDNATHTHSNLEIDSTTSVEATLLRYWRVQLCQYALLNSGTSAAAVRLSCTSMQILGTLLSLSASASSSTSTISSNNSLSFWKETWSDLMEDPDGDLLAQFKAKSTTILKFVRYSEVPARRVVDFTHFEEKEETHQKRKEAIGDGTVPASNSNSNIGSSSRTPTVSAASEESEAQFTNAAMQWMGSALEVMTLFWKQSLLMYDFENDEEKGEVSLLEARLWFSEKESFETTTPLQKRRAKGLVATILDFMEYFHFARLDKWDQPSVSQHETALLRTCIDFLKSMLQHEAGIVVLKTQMVTTLSTAQEWKRSFSSLGVAARFLHKIVILQHRNDHLPEAITRPWNACRDALIHFFHGILIVAQYHRRLDKRGEAAGRTLSYTEWLSEFFEQYRSAISLLYTAPSTSACYVDPAILALLKLQLDELELDYKEKHLE